MERSHSSSVITQEALHRMKKSSPLLEDTWYMIVAVSLCSLGQYDAVRETFIYVTQEADIPSEEQSRRSRRIREALLKVIPAIGLPRVINSLQAIHSSKVAALLDPRSPVSNRQLEWKHLPHDTIIARGREYVSRLHGDEQVVDQMDQSGTADLGLAVKICYGFVLSDVNIIDAVETGLVFLTALIAQGVHPQIEAHSHGALRNGASESEVRAVKALTEMVCQRFRQ